MRLGSPTAHAILLGLAIMVMAPMAAALDLIVADDPACGYCVKFKTEVGEGYDASPKTDRATLSYFTYSVGYYARPDLWPEWFKEAVEDGRITGGAIHGTPTFIVFDTVDGKMTEVGRWAGYGGVNHFNQMFEAVVGGYEAYKAAK